MSAKPETTFIASVHAHLPRKNKEPYRMKNHNEYNGGIFDVWYSGDRADLWVEYKFIVLPKRLTTVIVPNLSALQLEWGRERADEGRTMFVIVGCKEGGVVLGPHEWEAGISLEAFLLRISSRKELANFIKGLTT